LDPFLNVLGPVFECFVNFWVFREFASYQHFMTQFR
jgi:hypothetical protein